MDNRSGTDYFLPLKRLLVVLVTMPVVALLATGAFEVLIGNSHEHQGNIAAAKAQIKQFGIALESYKIKFGALPRSLESLLRPPSGEAIMIAKEVPLDPWGNAYRYLLVGLEGYVVVSLGADGEEGGDDEDADIRSDEIGNEHEKSSGTLKKLNESLPTDSRRFAQIIRTQRCV